MRVLKLIALYTALALSANSAAAGIEEAEALRSGTMKKLFFHSSGKPVSDATFTDADGAEFTLADWNGKYVVLNFWATWCAPCRKEMPALDALQAELGSDTFAVVTVATGRNPLPAITKFFDENEIGNLPILLDPKTELSRGMAALGLPVTMILNPNGEEIARMQGDAEWNGDSAIALLRALMDLPES
ncbi:MAG: redoxin domain-containing protein [Rhodobacteraceae bacterium]|nr:redoxin domain-containing protein [Paracoccaceae bacterium]